MRSRAHFSRFHLHGFLCPTLYCPSSQFERGRPPFIRWPPKEKELDGVLGNPAEWSGRGRLANDEQPPGKEPSHATRPTTCSCVPRTGLHDSRNQRHLTLFPVLHRVHRGDR